MYFSSTTVLLCFYNLANAGAIFLLNLSTSSEEKSASASALASASTSAAALATGAADSAAVSELLVELSSLAAETGDDSAPTIAAATSTVPSSGAADSSITGVPTTIALLPPSAVLSPLFNIYMIPSQFTPFQYTFQGGAFPFNNWGPPNFLDNYGNTAPSQSNAGVFAIVSPYGYLATIDPSTGLPYTSGQNFFADAADDLNDSTYSDFLDFDNLASGAQSLDASGRWSFVSPGPGGLGNGFPNGIGRSGVKLQLSGQGLQNGVARYCATMTPTGRGNGQAFVPEQPVLVAGYTRAFVNCTEAFLYAQAVSGSVNLGSGDLGSPPIPPTTPAPSAPSSPALPDLGPAGLENLFA
ncbi:uncharacterized protein PAC_15764 [Phialocephala subalpina]|uniref:Uncharacterized protein n=1 Tax=Phialocephala subalpina TaxID=576137 RepID=A0A1L7XLH8_9HELO|nr:uncharacterized protein PAC_15764 [Phialocephala subalpina]